jgi:Holliday junction DNA helicase RuvA
VVREDALLLYGFLTSEERDLFKLLISVSGIGPKMAQAVLSGLSATDVRRAIADGNVRTLITIPGVGRKLAERLVLELREKVQAGLASGPDSLPGSPGESSLREEATLALIALGYPRVTAEKSIKQALQENPGLVSSLEALIKSAIRQQH